MLDIKLISSKFPIITTGIACLLALLLFTLGIRVLNIDKIIESFELKALDWQFQCTQIPGKIDHRIALIVLDDISLQKAESNPELGLSSSIQPDITTAKVVDFLSQGGASVIAFNSKFEGSKLDTESSKPFIEAIKNAGNVILPFAFSYTDEGFEAKISQSGEIKNITDPNIRRQVINHLKKNLLSGNSEKLRNELSKFALNIINEDLFITFDYKKKIKYLAFAPIFYELLANCADIGSINLNPDHDGIVRSVNVIFEYNKNFYPSMALATAMKYLPEDKTELLFLENGNLQFGDRMIPLDKNGRVMIKWMGPAGTYTHYRISDILESCENLKSETPPKISPDKFKGKIVIIGETFAGPNKLTIPTSNTISGTELQANIIDNLINNRNFIKKIHPLGNFLIALLFSFLISLSVMRLKSGFSVAFTYAALVFIYFLVARMFFDYFSLWVDVIYPLGFMTVVFIVTFLVKYTILSKAYEDTFQLAIKDGLTGLYNHKYFQETLTRDLSRAKRHSDSLSVILVDIDHFKKFNDTYGHRAGDAILKQVAQALKKAVRTSDLVARYGGEEMVIIIYNADYENTKFVANKLLSGVHDTVFIFKNHTFNEINVSVGISNYPHHTDKQTELIEIADQALYYAKRNGRNQVGTYEQLKDSMGEQ